VVTDNVRRRGATGLFSVIVLVMVGFTTACEDGLTGLPTGEGERRQLQSETGVYQEDAPIYLKRGKGPGINAKGGKKPTDGGGSSDSTDAGAGGETPVTEPTQPAPVAKVTVSPSSVSLETGSTKQFSVKLYDASGTELTRRTVTWTSSKSLVASVSSAGLVTALAAGSAIITAKSEDATATASVTVTAPPPADSTPTGTAILPGQSIQSAVNANGAGTTFIIKAGVHRLQSVTPKSGNTFWGEPGAVLNGARLLTSWQGSGPWYHSVTFLSVGTAGSCRAGFEMCKDPNDIFIDDKPLLQVSSRGAVGAGTFYNDRANGRVYIGTNPSGRKVELSQSPFAFRSGKGTHNVTIKNLVIEKYANKGQFPVIDPRYSTSGTADPAGFGENWIVEYNEIRWNHAMGVRSWNGHIQRKNNVHHNGQLGFGGQGSNILVEANEIAYNGEWAGYTTGFEAGGSKWTRTKGLSVRNNYSHHNFGPGLWTDIDNINTSYEGNRVEDNYAQGIFHEISYDAIIRNNVVRRNGLGRKRASVYDAGILVAHSSNVEVYGNVVEDNWNGIGVLQQNRTDSPGAYGPYHVLNVYVHHNSVRTGDGNGYSGVTGDESFNPKLYAGSNRFDNNSYYASKTKTKYWSWKGGPYDWNTLKSKDQEPNSRMVLY
jgi:parallel beta-helix repeat protein